MSIDATQLGDVGARRRTALRRVARLVPVWLALCFFGSVAVARAESPNDLPLETYRTQVTRAQEVVHQADEALKPYYTEEEPWRMDDVLPPTAREELHRLLPERCTVTTPTGSVAVNNQSLRAALDNLCASENESEMRQRLHTLEVQLDIVQRHVSAPPGGDAADIRAILAREAFQPIKKTKTPLEYLQEWLIELLDKIFGKLPRSVRPENGAAGLWSNQWVQLGLWVGITLLLIGGGVWLVRRLRRQQAAADAGARIILGELVAPDMDAEELLAQARAAADAGDWRQAVRKVYIALLHDLDKREVVPLNPTWTNREYLTAVRTRTRIYPAMRELTDRFDVLWYGQHPGDREAYEQCLLRYREAQAALSAAA